MFLRYRCPFEPYDAVAILGPDHQAAKDSRLRLWLPASLRPAYLLPGGFATERQQEEQRHRARATTIAALVDSSLAKVDNQSGHKVPGLGLVGRQATTTAVRRPSSACP